MNSLKKSVDNSDDSRVISCNDLLPIKRMLMFTDTPTQEERGVVRNLISNIITKFTQNPSERNAETIRMLTKNMEQGPFYAAYNQIVARNKAIKIIEGEDA